MQIFKLNNEYIMINGDELLFYYNSRKLNV